MEPVQTTCQVIVLDCIIVTFGIRAVAHLTGAYIYRIMYIYGWYIVQT